MMPERELTIINKLGLHARAASKLVTVANGYNAEIHVNRDSQRVNAKSIMGVMMLAAEKGARLLVEVEGPDETDAAGADVPPESDGRGVADRAPPLDPQMRDLSADDESETEQAE